MRSLSCGIAHVPLAEEAAHDVGLLLSATEMRELGCDEVLGYLYSPPLGAPEFSTCLRGAG